MITFNKINLHQRMLSYSQFYCMKSESLLKSCGIVSGCNLKQKLFSPKALNNY